MITGWVIVNKKTGKIFKNLYCFVFQNKRHAEYWCADLIDSLGGYDENYYKVVKCKIEVVN